jgi:hypothetical protein
MKIAGREINLKFFLWYYCFNGLIVLDMFLITIALIFQLPNDTLVDIQYFDLIVCLILLVEYTFNLYHSSPKKDFILDPLNIVGLIASIPFDFILVTAIPGSGLLRYLRLFKLSRVFLLSSRLQIIKDLCRKTGLHKILGGLLGTAILFTILFYIFGPTYGGFDDFYFVIVTLTTVGYGDVTPVTYNEKVLAIILILIGIFVFSTITAAMSSFLTDRILDDDEEDIKSEINKTIENKSENIMGELKVVREENNELKDEINELKDEINELKDLIKNK